MSKKELKNVGADSVISPQGDFIGDVKIVQKIVKKDEVKPKEVEAKLGEYCDLLAQDKDMHEAHKVYVPVQGSVDRNYTSKFDVRAEVDKFLHPDSAHINLLLMGNSGSGKTMFCQNVAMELAGKYKEAGVIPLFISLPAAKKVTQNLVQDHLKESGFSDAEIEYLKNNREFIFIFDSYDEVSYFKNNNLANLYTANHLYDWKAKSIFSCRTTYIVNRDRYKLYFMPYKDAKPYPAGFREMYVAPFSNKEIEDYIKLYLGHNADDLILLDERWSKLETYAECIEELSGLSEIITNPFLLRMTMEVLPSTAEKYKDELDQNKRKLVTSLDLYEAYATRWFERQLDKLIWHNEGGLPTGKDGDPLEITIKAYEDYAKRLAVAMDNEEVTHINSKTRQWKEFFSNDELIVVLRKGCPLIKVGQDQWAFLHANLQEYFVSKDMLERKLELEQQLREMQSPRMRRGLGAEQDEEGKVKKEKGEMFEMM